MAEIDFQPLDFEPLAPADTGTGDGIDFEPVGQAQGVVNSFRRGNLAGQRALEALQLLDNQGGPTMRQGRAAFEQALGDPEYLLRLGQAGEDPEAMRRVESLFGPGRRLDTIRTPIEQQRTATAQNIAQLTAGIEAIPQSAAMQEWAAADNSNWWEVFARNPVEITANIFAESLPQASVAMASGMAGGLAGGPVGAAGGVAGGSFGVEFANALIDAAGKSGVDLHDPAQVRAFFADEDKVKQARAFAAKRGFPIAALDALTAGVAGKFLKPALGRGVGPVLGASAAETGVQMAGGAGGEALAQVATGEPLSAKDILAEAVGELATAPAEITTNLRHNRRTTQEQARAEAGPIDFVPTGETSNVQPGQSTAAARPVETRNPEDVALGELAGPGREQLLRRLNRFEQLSEESLADLERTLRENQVSPGQLDEEMRQARERQREQAELDREADRVPKPMEEYAGLLSEEGRYSTIEAVRENFGRVSAPPLQAALEKLRRGFTVPQVLSEWSGGRGETDALGDVLEQIWEARRLKRMAEYSRLTKAYQQAFQESKSPNVDTAVQALEDARERGFNPSGGVPESGGELYGRLWDEAVGAGGGKRKPVELSPQEKALYFVDVVSSRRGRGRGLDGGEAVAVEALKVGDRFSVRGVGLRVTGLDPDSGAVTVEETGEGVNAGLFGRQELNPEQVRRIFPDKGSWQPLDPEDIRQGEYVANPRKNYSAMQPPELEFLKAMGDARAGIELRRRQREAARPAAEPEDDVRFSLEDAPAGGMDWELYAQELVANLDSFDPARHTGRPNYELNDVADRFVELAKADTLNRSWKQLASEFGRTDEEVTPKQLRQLKEAIKDLEAQFPRPGSGQNPPFSLTAEEAFETESFRRTIGQAKFDESRERGRQRAASRRAAVEQAVASVREELPGAPAVKVVDAMEDLPAEMLASLEDGQQAEGGVFGDTIYLVAANLPSGARARQVVAHEAIGHYGLRAVLGPEFGPFMESVYRKHAGEARTRQLAELYGADVTTPAGRQLVGEELVARLAEGEIQDPTLWQRIVAIVQRWFRRLTGATIGEAEIRTALARARERVRQPVQAAPPAAAPVEAGGETEIEGDSSFALPDRVGQEMSNELPAEPAGDTVAGDETAPPEIPRRKQFDIPGQRDDANFRAAVIANARAAGVLHPRSDLIRQYLLQRTSAATEQLHAFRGGLPRRDSGDIDWRQLSSAQIDRFFHLHDQEITLREQLARWRRLEGGGITYPPHRFALGEGGREFESSKRNHGVTSDINEAGYVLPDGSLLDFSGRSQMQDAYEFVVDRFVPKKGQRDWQKGARQVDHREIEFDGAPRGEQWSAMVEFMKRGAVRIDAKSGMISVHGRRPLTSAQEKVIRQIVEQNAGQVFLDAEDDSGRRMYQEYNADNSKKIIGDLKRWSRGDEPESGVRFSLSDESLPDRLAQLQAHMDALDLEIFRVRQTGQAARVRELLGQRAEALAEFQDLRYGAAQAAEWVEGAGEPGPAEMDAITRAALDRVSSASLDDRGSAESFWEKLKRGLRYFGSSTPEIALTGTEATEAARFRRGVRLFGVESQNARRRAANDIRGVLKPIADLGRRVVDGNRMEQFFELGRRIRREEDRANPNEARLARLRRQREQVRAKLEENPFYLFQQAVLWRDLWYRKKFLRTSNGQELAMPGGLELDQIETAMQANDRAIQRNAHQAAVRESLKRHYQLMADLQESLLQHGELIPEELRNPLYFPHHLLDRFTGKLDWTKPTTEQDFRSYLIRPVGSEKLIEAGYLNALYKHVNDVYAHNARADVVAKYWQPYDQAAARQAELAAEGLEEGRTVHEEAWKRNIPPGMELFTPSEEIPLRADYIIDRQVLANALGVALGDGDIRERMRELGVEINLTPEMIQQALVAGERPQWLLPSPIAEAIRGVVRREQARSADSPGRWLGNMLSKPLNLWKANTLFNWYNYPRYEWGNTITDVIDKMLGADPGLMRYLGRALREIQAAANGEKTADFEAAEREGVMQTITANEVAELTKLKEFEDFISDRAWRLNKAHKFITWTARSSQLRESTFRYAKWLADVERMREGKAPVYAGAYWRDVQAVEGVEARAAEIVTRTFGDYGNLSVTGQWLRRHVIPFWSWQEVNLKYHANLFRNLYDMVTLPEGERPAGAGAAARAAAVGTAAFTAKAAVGIFLRLAVMRLGVELWNQMGGAWAGLWDDDDDLEGQLSEADRRRFHLLLGKDENGKARVVYVPNALSDVAEWFGGNNFARLFVEWARGDIGTGRFIGDFAKQLPTDLANKVVQGARPDAKFAYMAVSGKDPFPDITDQRNISRDNLGWLLLQTVTDRDAATFIRSKLDKDYYQPEDFGEWWQRKLLQIRRRDADQWSYYEIRDKAADWKEAKTGKRNDGMDYQSPDQQVIRNFRKAIYRADIPNAIRFYQRAQDYGYTAERFTSSIRASDPLSDLSKAERGEFVESLNRYERGLLERAFRHYSKLAASKGRERTLFPRAGQKGFEPDFNRLIDGVLDREAMTPDEVEERSQRLLKESLRPAAR